MRVLSGMRPTGRLHIGHLFGALHNWLKLQKEHESYFFVADWHALTTDYANTANIKENSLQMVMDWLAAGIDPQKSVLFIQSHVPEHAELHVLLSMITPLSWLERVPTYKEQQEALSNRDLSTYGFLGYPLLQSADILIYKTNFVPVGGDQLPHIEFTREVTRRFNFMYREVFPVPEPQLTQAPKLPGTDGRKMSKSYDNCIYLSDSPETISAKVRTMFTDPARLRRHDPGHPDICPAFSWHKLFTAQAVYEDIHTRCMSAGIGCTDCKKILIDNMIKALAPIYEKRIAWENKRQEVEDILRQGSISAKCIAQATLGEVRDAMGLIV
ncbi:MAG: tryptophan--tRNA ligase [Candidatus Schekmanbacteria bacterium]|nr:tryptophan--tRNA ligase [Candidatus Schekmanbacteria bacterium]